ncbi:hypothetical protein [Achromobacter spanius]|uniref:hypothetical protein n=1 Tax=Achromobacter spanius TaxID=217203 RepID=UPI00381D4BF1
MSDHERIREEFNKKLPSRRAQLCHCGAIVVLSLVSTCVLFQVVELPTALASPQAHVARFAAGLLLASGLALAGLLVYLIGSWLRERKLLADATEQMVKASMRAISRGR